MTRITTMPVRTSVRLGALRLTGLILAAAAVVAACSSSSPVTVIGCSLNSDCQMGLICALGKCRTQCVNATDCPVMGSTCIDDGRNAVCEVPADKNKPCTQESDCPVPLACASDYRCRNLCQSAADCNVLGITGRVCAADLNGVDYCADPSEVSDAGVIDLAPPLGANTNTPVIEPEGGTSAQVAALQDGGLIATNIGQAGGTIGILGVKVTIPAGALTATLPITIALSAQTGPVGTVGQVFEIGPTGTTFAQPITIAFDYTATELLGLPPSDFAVETSTNSGASWTPLSQIVVDITAQTIAGQTTHLSPYALVEQQVATGTTGEGGSGGSYSDGGASSVPPAVDSGAADAGSPNAEAGATAGDASL
jgi:hypothetical protein